MKVYLLIKTVKGDLGSSYDDVLGVYYSIVGAKAGAERKGLVIEWQETKGNPGCTSVWWALSRNESYVIDEREIE